MRSVVILLRPRADGPEMSGTVRHAVGDEPYLEFHHRVLRIWKVPAAEILAGGVGTLPPLAELAQAELPAVIRCMAERVNARERRTAAERGCGAVDGDDVLLGLRYDQALAGELLKGVRAMEESVTYQAIIEKGMAKGKAEGLAEGRVEEARRILLTLGTDVFGAPDAATQAALAGLGDREQLEALIRRVAKVKNWPELLGKPSAKRGKGPKRS